MQSTSKPTIGAATILSKPNRDFSKPAGKARSGSEVPNPGQSRQNAASNAHPVDTTVTNQAVQYQTGEQAYGDWHSAVW
jgi:hypothetical protein